MVACFSMDAMHLCVKSRKQSFFGTMQIPQPSFLSHFHFSWPIASRRVTIATRSGWDGLRGCLWPLHVACISSTLDMSELFMIRPAAVPAFERELQAMGSCNFTNLLLLHHDSWTSTYLEYPHLLEQHSVLAAVVPVYIGTKSIQ